jgi:hypothetical protein
MRTYHQARFGEGHLVLARDGTVIKHRSNELSGLNVCDLICLH